MAKQKSRMEKAIIESINNAAKRVWSNNDSDIWTKEIKKTLVNLGHKNGFKVYTAPKNALKADKGEWLYDLCWAKNAEAEKFNGLKLIAEIEWQNNKKSILEDFNKLTVGVADYRLMVAYFNEKSPLNDEIWVGDLVETCKKISSSNKGFRYFLILIPHHDIKKTKIFNW